MHAQSSHCDAVVRRSAPVAHLELLARAEYIIEHVGLDAFIADSERWPHPYGAWRERAAVVLWGDSEFVRLFRYLKYLGEKLPLCLCAMPVSDELSRELAELHEGCARVNKIKHTTPLSSTPLKARRAFSNIFDTRVVESARADFERLGVILEGASFHRWLTADVPTHQQNARLSEIVLLYTNHLCKKGTSLEALRIALSYSRLHETLRGCEFAQETRTGE
jgi:hypothetical protein